MGPCCFFEWNNSHLSPGSGSGSTHGNDSAFAPSTITRREASSPTTSSTSEQAPWPTAVRPPCADFVSTAHQLPQAILLNLFLKQEARHAAQRPRTSGTDNMTFSLVDTETLSSLPRPIVPRVVKDMERFFDSSTIGETGSFGKTRFTFPVASLVAFELHMRSLASCDTSDHEAPRAVIERLTVITTCKREQRGDVIIRPLDEGPFVMLSHALVDFEKYGVHFRLR